MHHWAFLNRKKYIEMRVSNKLASLDASFIYFAFSRKMQSASCRYKRYACQLTYRLFIQLYLYGMDHLDIYAWHGRILLSNKVISLLPQILLAVSNLQSFVLTQQFNRGPRLIQANRVLEIDYVAFSVLTQSFLFAIYGELGMDS